MPLKTRKYVSRPTNSSALVLNTSAATGPFGSGGSSRRAPVTVAVSGGTSSGLGNSSRMARSSGMAPMFAVPAAQKIGASVPPRIAAESPLSISSSLSSKSSRYLSVRSSSASATRSVSPSRASSTASDSSAGTSDAALPSPRYALRCTRSTTPLNALSSPIGSCTGWHCGPSWAWISATVSSQRAFSRSSRLTTIARGIPRSSVSRQAVSVPTCGPAAASTRISAVSAAAAPAINSPTKSA